MIAFTDPDKPFEIAFFDRGPVDAPSRTDADPTGAAPTASGARSPQRGAIGDSWGANYCNGAIHSSEMTRGLDILELEPSANLSANEIAAAK